MLMDILSTILVVGILYAIVCVPVGMFNAKVFQAVHGAKCTGLSLGKALIPFCNITFSRRLTYGRAPVFRALLLVCVGLLLFRFVALALVTVAPLLIVFSSLTTVACIALYWLLYIVNAIDFCRMFNCGFVIKLACIVLAPVGYYMLSTQVLGYFRSVEDEVSGRFGA